MEVRQEIDYVLHHAQKVTAIFAAMRTLAAEKAEAGHRIEYLKISDLRTRQNFADNLDWLIARFGATSLEWQSPDEWRLDQQLRGFGARLGIPIREVGR